MLVVAVVVVVVAAVARSFSHRSGSACDAKHKLTASPSISVNDSFANGKMPVLGRVRVAASLSERLDSSGLAARRAPGNECHGTWRAQWFWDDLAAAS